MLMMCKAKSLTRTDRMITIFMQLCFWLYIPSHITIYTYPISGKNSENDILQVSYSIHPVHPALPFLLMQYMVDKEHIHALSKHSMSLAWCVEGVRGCHRNVASLGGAVGPALCNDSPQLSQHGTHWAWVGRHNCQKGGLR